MFCPADLDVPVWHAGCNYAMAGDLHFFGPTGFYAKLYLGYGCRRRSFFRLYFILGSLVQALNLASDHV